MQVISTIPELDAALDECAAAARIGDAALRQAFLKFRFDFSKDVPQDPFSPEYHAAQMALYKHLTGRDYTPANEVSKLDIAASDLRPFPFQTGNPRTAGFFTMGMGFLLHVLDLKPGDRVVEFGPGWGNSTMAMAMTGLDVTAVDIESDFCELLRRRARRQEIPLTVVNADFMWAETVTEPYDAAVFFECFHHCSDHMRLLRALATAVKPGGRVYFATEPILADFPLPWGLRMDGESLWAIRSQGWMELGFNSAYFQQALARTGWVAKRHALPGLEWAAVWEARRGIPDEPAAAAAVPTQLHGSGTAQAELDAIYRSTSWRVTAPLRGLARLLGRG